MVTVPPRSWAYILIYIIYYKIILLYMQYIVSMWLHAIPLWFHWSGTPAKKPRSVGQLNRSDLVKCEGTEPRWAQCRGTWSSRLCSAWRSCRCQAIPCLTVITLAVWKSALMFSFKNIVLLKCCLHYLALLLHLFISLLFFIFIVIAWLHGYHNASTDLGTFSVCGDPSAQLCEARRFIFLTLATVAAQSEELSP